MSLASNIDRLDRKTQFEHAAATASYQRITLNASGQAVIATAGDIAFGVTLDTVSAGQQGFVVADGPGLNEKMADAAIASGVYVYGAADGEVSATAGPWLEGRAVSAATAKGDFVLVDQTHRGPVAVTHVVTTGEASADVADIDTGFGDALAFAHVQVIEPTNGTVRAVINTRTLSGVDAGKVRVGSTAMVAGDIIQIIPVLFSRVVA